MNSNLQLLQAYYRERAKEPGTKSYTRKLLDAGVGKCAKKVLEEAGETVIAAVSESDENLVAESADLIYHLLVLLESRNISIALVEEKLEQRKEKSGLEEKASRQS